MHNLGPFWRVKCKEPRTDGPIDPDVTETNIGDISDPIAEHHSNRHLTV